MTRKDCEIITPFYYSNCVLEALRAKIRNPHIKIYICLPYRRSRRDIRSMHILWEDENHSYDFSDDSWTDNGHFWQYFWYKGAIRRWPKNFAKEFSQKRNDMAKRSWSRKKYVTIG